MPRKTRKAQRKSPLKTIPELRQSFEYIEQFVAQRLASNLPKDRLVKELKTEWYRVFSKRLSASSATALVEQYQQRRPSRHRLTHKRGGAAPVDMVMRAGLYPPQGAIPPSAYGLFTSYVQSGFQVPEIAAKGAADWPSPSPTMGSNLVQGGGHGSRRGNRSLRQKRTGGAWLQGVFSHPVQSTAPPSLLQDALTQWQGAPLGASSDQVQRRLSDSVGTLPVRSTHVTM